MPFHPARYLKTAYRLGITITFLVLSLNSCSQPTSTMPVKSSTSEVDKKTTTLIAASPTGTPLWFDGFESANWQQHWLIAKEGQWGLQNTQLTQDASGVFAKVLQVRYPKGSASPTVSRKYGAPLGGTGFYGNLGISPKNALRLSYYVRFSNNFDFVKGGKLPGLFGGTGNSGGDIPNGKDGFSTRLMWRKNGDGEVYAYLPTSKKYGTSIGRGSWQFKPGQWYHLEQQVELNQPGKNDGRIQVWVDGKSVINQNKLKFRTTDSLKINGIFFSTFFGGDDPSWATPKDVNVDFAKFSVYAVN